MSARCDHCCPSFQDCWNDAGPCRKLPLQPQSTGHCVFCEEAVSLLCPKHAFDMYAPKLPLPPESQTELEELRRWKREALTVFNNCEPQKLAKLLGMPLGVDVLRNLVPAITKVVSRVAELEAYITKTQPMLDTYLATGISWNGKWVNDRAEDAEARVTVLEKVLEQLLSGIHAHAKQMDELMNRPPDFSRGQRIAKMIGDLESLAKAAEGEERT